MRCSICKRPLLHCAVPGLQIGPKCAKDRGLMPERSVRIRLFNVARTEDELQEDWIKNMNAGSAGEGEASESCHH